MKIFRGISSLSGIGMALALSACGGGGDSSSAPAPVSLPPSMPAPTPAPPTTPPTPAPAPNDFQPVIDAIESSNDPDFAVIIGDANGILFEHEKGNYRLEDNVLIASASKWYTGATIMRLVDKGLMDLSDNPQDYLSFWTSDPSDQRSQITLEQLLSFTSGFNAEPNTVSCVGDGAITILQCVQQIYDSGLGSDPGTGFYYGPHHMHVAAAMAEQATGLSYNDIFRREVANPLGFSQVTRFATPSASNPRAAGGAFSNASDYALFLRALLDGSLMAEPDVFFKDYTSAVEFLSRPAGAGGDWHYAFGAWLECDEANFVPSCADAQIYSSPGSFGWTPWIDRRNGYFALIARDGARASAPVAIAIEQELQPLILQALGK
ncbi:serine hydrolase domain-containing protein [Parasphingorhabdus sp.]|uniref:serine hydrolase domain-containing protein n=2 Tax=Parasphingorhabdus sp. TaxID=2709688 RepID=UPI00326446BB